MCVSCRRYSTTVTRKWGLRMIWAYLQRLKKTFIITRWFWWAEVLAERIWTSMKMQWVAHVQLWWSIFCRSLGRRSRGLARLDHYVMSLWLQKKENCKRVPGIILKSQNPRAGRTNCRATAGVWGWEFNNALYLRFWKQSGNNNRKACSVEMAICFWHSEALWGELLGQAEYGGHGRTATNHT